MNYANRVICFFSIMIEIELYKRIEELESENRLLRAENEKPRKELGTPEEKVVIRQEKVPFLNKYSSPTEKIEFFMSLFRGRTDVYAKRCYSIKHGSSYYVPACKNEWVKDVCNKGRSKCKDCSKEM